MLDQYQDLSIIVDENHSVMSNHIEVCFKSQLYLLWYHYTFLIYINFLLINWYIQLLFVMIRIVLAQVRLLTFLV